jgi:hypothetical protein
VDWLFDIATLLYGGVEKAIAYEEQERRKEDRFASTLVIAASIIAAVRLAHDDISTSTPRLLSEVANRVNLARMILKKVLGN